MVINQWRTRFAVRIVCLMEHLWIDYIDIIFVHSLHIFLLLHPCLCLIIYSLFAWGKCPNECRKNLLLLILFHKAFLTDIPVSEYRCGD